VTNVFEAAPVPIGADDINGNQGAHSLCVRAIDDLGRLGTRLICTRLLQREAAAFANRAAACSTRA
jgi:hypothetical protein